MRNKFSAWCIVCSKRVRPNEGDTNKVHGRFVTKHLTCIKDDRQARAEIPRMNEDDNFERYENPQRTLPL